MSSIKGDIVKEYMKKYQKISKRSLARKIYEENKLTFHDSEHARSIIRYYTGSMGYKLRLSIRELNEGNKKYNKYILPDSDESELEPVFIEHKKTLILADLHIPYHSIEALETAIDYGLKYNPDAILLFGDIIDMYMISRFSKDPTKRSISGELKMLRGFFNKLIELFPNSKIYWKYGNHEERWDIFLMQNAPQLYDMEEMHLGHMFKDLPIQIIKDKRRIRIGKLDGVHGHELFRGVYSPVNHARGLSQKTKKAAICGHGHTTSEHTEMRLNGEMYTCWSIGCMCELHQEYNAYTNRNHGFATVDLHDNGNFNCKNYRIHNGEIL